MRGRVKFLFPLYLYDLLNVLQCLGYLPSLFVNLNPEKGGLTQRVGYS